MNYLHDLPSGEGDVIYVVVEIPKGSRNKYEYDPKLGVFKLDRVLYSPFFYPVEYGFMAKSWYEDEDPLDVMVYIREPTFSGCVLKCRVVGLLRMKDEHGIDDKVLAVPVDDPIFEKVKEKDDVPPALLEEIAHFFKRYKDLEKGKHVEVIGWFGKEEAVKAVEKARRIYAERYGGKSE